MYSFWLCMILYSSWSQSLNFEPLGKLSFGRKTRCVLNILPEDRFGTHPWEYVSIPLGRSAIQTNIAKKRLQFLKQFLVRFWVQTSPNLDRTMWTRFQGFGPRFIDFVEPDARSSSRFEKYLKEQDQTGPRHHYLVPLLNSFHANTRGWRKLHPHHLS